jgi:hypothetical protein
MSGFIDNGVTAKAGGYAQPAYAQPNLFQAMMFNAMVKDSGSGSYPSSSSKVSIVKYDDHFKEKGWCVKNLGLTEEEVKNNPPLALKFGDCPVVVPIPSYKAMCATTDAMVKESMTPGEYAKATPEKKKEEAKIISFALAKKFKEECGYGDSPLKQECLPQSFPHELTPWTQAENATDFADNPGDDAVRNLRHYMGKFTTQAGPSVSHHCRISGQK